jgi:hypothetical protein
MGPVVLLTLGVVAAALLDAPAHTRLVQTMLHPHRRHLRGLTSARAYPGRKQLRRGDDVDVVDGYQVIQGAS